LFAPPDEIATVEIAFALVFVVAVLVVAVLVVAVLVVIPEGDLLLLLFSISPNQKPVISTEATGSLTVVAQCRGLP
jgi:hypothetical protein